MKKKVKRYKIDFEALKKFREYTMNQIVRGLNDDACNLSSCEIRKYMFDAIE